MLRQIIREELQRIVEAKDPNDIPKAIISSVITATFIYVLVAIAVVKCCNTKTLHQSAIPIVSLTEDRKLDEINQKPNKQLIPQKNG